LNPEPPRSAPIRIYLDTSDYSRFADIGYREEPGIPAILDFLREKKSQGLIEIRFSAVHLFEFLKDPSQRELALRKTEVVEELCGDLAFRYFTDVFDREREALRSGADPEPLVTSDEGEWFPNVALDGSFHRDAIIPNLLNKFPSLGRSQIEALLQDPRAAAFFKEHMSRQMPLEGIYNSDLLDRFLSDKTEPQKMSQEVMKGFAKPRILIGHYLEGNTNALEFFSNLSVMERKIYENTVRSRDVLKEHVNLVLSLGEDVTEKVRQYVRNIESSVASASYLGLDELPAGLRDSVGRGRFLSELPAVSTHCNLLNAYVRDIIYPSEVMPKIKESDPADILHATYLPYVDLYRTDGRFSSLVERLPKPPGVTVVHKLRQLTDAIEKALTRRPK
jgi:hypothetical protein